MTTQPQIKLSFRYMLVKDIKYILDIDYQSKFNKCLEKDDLLKYKNDNNTVCLVARHGNEIVAFAIYESSVGLNLLRFRVAECYRRMGFGSKMMDYIKTYGKSKIITCHLHERNLGGQLFLKSQGFDYIKTKRNMFLVDDGYCFAYKSDEI